MCCGSYYIKFTMFYKGFSLHIVLAIIMAVTILHADGLQEKKIVSEISKNLKGQLMKSPLEWTKTQVSNEFQSIRLESKAGKHKTQNRLEREKVLSLGDEVSENQTSFEMEKVTNVLQEIETSFPYPHTPETQVYSEESTSFPSPSSVESPSSSSSTLTLENLSPRPTLKTSGTLTRSSSSTQNESRFEAALIAETTLKGSPSEDIGLGKAGRIPFRSKTVFNEGSRTYPVVRTESGHKPIPSTVKGKSNEVKQGQTEKYPHESSDLEQENVHRNLTSHENFDYVMNETFHEKSAHSLKTEDHKTESYFEETGYVFEDSANTRIKGQEKGLVGDLILSLLLDALKPYYLPTLTENKECRRVVNFGFNKNIKHLDWAMHMFDSWGKISDGFLFGNMHLVGMFEECLAVEGSYKPVVTPAINFTGQYCQIHYRNLKPTNTSTKKSAHSLLVEDLLGGDPLTNWLSRGHRVTGQRQPQGLRSGPALSLLAEPIGFSYATCIPSICSEDDLFTSLNKTLEDHQAIVTKVKCIKVENEEPITYDPPDLAMISFLATVSVWILLSTVYDVTTNCLEMDALRHGWFRVPLCFSLNQSLPALFRQKSGSSPHRITCLPGIRVVTMIWIIICHQYATAIDFVMNTLDTPKYQDPVVAQVVSNGWRAVDTFFFLGGLVAAYRIILQARYGKSINIVLIYIRRILRIAPSIFVVAAFCATLLKFFAYGPRASFLHRSLIDKCEKFWWKDPLFVNNFDFGPEASGGEVVEDCLSHTWYTAVDFQLFLILPILILPLLRHRNIGLVWLSVMTMASLATPLAIVWSQHLPPTPLISVLKGVSYEYSVNLYLTPWCRAAPWIVGIWTAWILTRHRTAQLLLNKFVVLIGYVLAISMGMTLVFGVYRYNHLLPYEESSFALSAFYNAFGGPAWALCLAWVVVTCHSGNASTVNAILSYPGWQPLGRLTLGLYLVSPCVQAWWSSVQFVPVYYNYLAKLFESAGVIFVAGVVAVLLYCFVEYPVQALDRTFILGLHDEPTGDEIEERRHRKRKDNEDLCIELQNENEK